MLVVYNAYGKCNVFKTIPETHITPLFWARVIHNWVSHYQKEASAGLTPKVVSPKLIAQSPLEAWLLLQVRP